MRLSESLSKCIFWPIRLAVRTQGFQPWNSGSTPLLATINIYNMSKLFDKYKSRYLRRIVSSKDYIAGRINTMNEYIQCWKSHYKDCNTNKGREYCQYMLNLYLKRYKYYLNKR